MKKVGIYLMFCLFLGAASLSAQEVKDSVQIHFRMGKSHLDASWRDNRQSLDRIADSLRIGYSDSIYSLQKIWVVGAASPEGSIRLNKELSEKRAETLFSYLSQYRILPDSLKTADFIGRDWNGLLRLAEEDPRLPYREETLALLRNITQGANTVNDPLKLIQELRGGVPYRYMYRHLFPELRYSSLYLWYRKIQNPQAPVQLPPPVVVFRSLGSAVQMPDSIHIASAPVDKPFYMAIKTNLLYDALFVPNIGVEFYLGKD